jgi:hypothetical protein
MKKEDALTRWKSKPANLPIKPHVSIIPYKTSGSKYGAGGVRIDGTPEFIDAVLSRLKDLIEFENGVTRLELSRSEVKAVTVKGETKGFANAAMNAETCYVRVHERGYEAQIVNTRYGHHSDADLA